MAWMSASILTAPVITLPPYDGPPAHEILNQSPVGDGWRVAMATKCTVLPLAMPMPVNFTTEGRMTAESTFDVSRLQAIKGLSGLRARSVLESAGGRPVPEVPPAELRRGGRAGSGRQDAEEGEYLQPGATGGRL